MPASGPQPSTERREQCVSCAFPLDSDSDIFSVLSRLRDMLSHVGFTVDRFLMEESRDIQGKKSVTLELQPSQSLKRSRPSSPGNVSSDPASKRILVSGCKLCASSCCSTNSLCRANVCGHGGDEESNPAPPSPDRHRHHVHGRKNGLAYTHGHPNLPAAARQHESHHHHHHHHHGPRALHLTNVVDTEDVLPLPSAVGSKGEGKAVIPPNSVVRARCRTSDIHQHEPGKRALSSVAKNNEDVKSAEEVDTARASERGGNATVDATGPPLEREISSRSTATTGKRGLSFDGADVRRHGAIDFQFDSRRSNPKMLNSAFQSAMTPGRPRVATLPRLLSPEVNRVLACPSPHAVESSSQDQEQGALGDVVSAETPRPPPELVCRSCGLKFCMELELRRHQFMEHKDGKVGNRTNDGRFRCLMHSCTQSFVRRHVMERHFKSVHLLVRDFPCSSCDKSFADSSTREAHRSAVHEKRKPYICEQCSSCFTQSSSLGKHRRRFHQEGFVTGRKSKG